MEPPARAGRAGVRAVRPESERAERWRPFPGHSDWIAVELPSPGARGTLGVALGFGLATAISIGETRGTTPQQWTSAAPLRHCTDVYGTVEVWEEGTMQAVRFGRFEFDLESLELLEHGSPVSLQPKPPQVLSALLARPGRLVSRGELRATV